MSIPNKAVRQVVERVTEMFGEPACLRSLCVAAHSMSMPNKAVRQVVERVTEVFGEPESRGTGSTPRRPPTARPAGAAGTAAGEGACWSPEASGSMSQEWCGAAACPHAAAKYVGVTGTAAGPAIWEPLAGGGTLG